MQHSKRPDIPLMASGLLFAALFLLATSWHDGQRPAPGRKNAGQVVISAPVQLLLFAGDHYLAADMEAIRASTITLDNASDRSRAAYRLRSHAVVSRLNPCHEDNYYLGNAVLTWGGLQQQGNTLLGRATECRFWDDTPPFLLGFNHYFFFNEYETAIKLFELAADRATNNTATLRKLAIMVKMEEFDDEAMARNYLQQQLQQTEDPKLQDMLRKRLTRLEGLITLRTAQRRYETSTGKALAKPSELLSSGLLEQFPADPMGLGYEFVDGIFRLREMQVQGLEGYR